MDYSRGMPSCGLPFRDRFQQIIETRRCGGHKMRRSKRTPRERRPVLGHVPQLDPLPIAGDQHGMIPDPGPAPKGMHPELVWRTGAEATGAAMTQGRDRKPAET